MTVQPWAREAGGWFRGFSLPLKGGPSTTLSKVNYRKEDKPTNLRILYDLWSLLITYSRQVFALGEPESTPELDQNYLFRFLKAAMP